MGERKLSDSGCTVGRLGWLYINDTSAHTGPFGAIKFHGTTVVAAINADHSNGSAVAGGSFGDGYEILGTINSIELTSGACFAYKVDALAGT